MDYLDKLEEGKLYTIIFDHDKTYSTQTITAIKVLIKLTNSIKIQNIDTQEIKWYRSGLGIIILDEIPQKYFRKEKLEKLEKLENE